MLQIRYLCTPNFATEDGGQPRRGDVGPGRRGFCHKCGSSALTLAVHSAIRNAQEVAGNHGVAMWGRGAEGFATDPIMVENHLIFVATRIQIRMEEYPQWWVLKTAAFDRRFRFPQSC